MTRTATRGRRGRSRRRGSTARPTTLARSATTAIVAAATATPSGWAIWRMPIASPRRWAGNQPTTMRPLADPVQAANMPTTKRTTTSGTVPSTVVARAPRSVVPPRPASRTARSPMPVHHQAPDEQRHHHPGDRRGGDGAGLRQREPAVVLELRDQEGRAVDRDRRPGLRRHAGREHRPPPRRADRGGVGGGHRLTLRGGRAAGSRCARSWTRPRSGAGGRRPRGRRRSSRCRRAGCRCGPGRPRRRRRSPG